MGRKDHEKEARALAPWQAFSELSRWEQELERLFDSFVERRMGLPSSGGLWPLRSSNVPAVDIYEDEDDLVAKIELPGLVKEDIDVSVSNHTLTVKAEKKAEEEIKRENYHRIERSRGALRRSVSLPADVETEQIKANFKNGVLEIRMPRSPGEYHRQQRIEVQG